MSNPRDTRTIEEAKAAFEKAEKEYNNFIQGSKSTKPITHGGVPVRSIPVGNDFKETREEFVRLKNQLDKAKNELDELISKPMEGSDWNPPPEKTSKSTEKEKTAQPRENLTDNDKNDIIASVKTLKELTADALDRNTHIGKSESVKENKEKLLTEINAIDNIVKNKQSGEMEKYINQLKVDLVKVREFTFDSTKPEEIVRYNNRIINIQETVRQLESKVVEKPLNLESTTPTQKKLQEEFASKDRTTKSHYVAMPKREVAMAAKNENKHHHHHRHRKDPPDRQASKQLAEEMRAAKKEAKEMKAAEEMKEANNAFSQEKATGFNPRPNKK